MLGKTHSLLVQLLTAAPSALRVLAPEIALWASDSEPISVLSEDFTQAQPTEYRADAVLGFGEPPLRIAVIEVQTSRDAEKWWSWPVYVAVARARYRVPTTLVVVTTNPKVARWARRPIRLGNNAELRAHVVGPDEIAEHVQAADLAGQPELAVLLMMAHSAIGREPPLSLGVTAMRAIALGDPRLAEQDRLLYLDIVTELVPAAVRSFLEAEMNLENWEPKTDFVKDLVARREAAYQAGHEEGHEEGREQGREEGLIRGRREALLLVLQTRGLGVSDEQADRIERCEDSELLLRWISEAASASDARNIAAD